MLFSFLAFLLGSTYSNHNVAKNKRLLIKFELRRVHFSSIWGSGGSILALVRHVVSKTQLRDLKPRSRNLKARSRNLKARSRNL